jgi:hypothetical protein
MPPPSPTDFETVIGVMRLAHKYDVVYLFQRALSHLDSMFPTDFSKFLHLNGKMGDYDSHVRFIRGNVDVDVMAFRAASEVGASWILPTAYYNIIGAPDMLAATENILTLHQQQMCLAARAELARATATTYRFLRNLPCSSCDSETECRDLISDAQDAVDFWTDNQLDLDPLTHWAVIHLENELCAACHKVGHERFTDAQRLFWDRMPGIFGLPNWDELREMRRKAMEGTA